MALYQEKLSNEAQLRPRAGERVALSTGRFTWTAVQLGRDSYQLDLEKVVRAARPESPTANRVAFAVAYIVSERAQTGLKALVGSDDTARIYLNGREIYRQLTFRAWEADQDEVSGVELKAGLNVLVFKVVNGDREWAGSVRLLDADGQPIQGIRVTLDPDAVQ